MVAADIQLPRAGFLVVEDPKGSPIQEQKVRVPGLVGSNILRKILDEMGTDYRAHLSRLGGAGKEWNMALALFEPVGKRIKEEDVNSVVRVGGHRPARIPARSSIILWGSTRQRRARTREGIIERLDLEHPEMATTLPAGIITGWCHVGASVGCPSPSPTCPLRIST